MTHQGRSDRRADLRPIQREDWNERWQRQVAAEANRSNQAPSPGIEAEEAGDPILQLAEALKPFGFRWPGPQPATAPARGPSAESLFLKAGQSAAAYRHWRANTRINLRLSRLFLLMRQGWSNEAIEEAISETALASWWLSGNSCPLGFYSSGNYCLSSPSYDREAIQKTGKSCPLGWFSSGSYCVKSR